MTNQRRLDAAVEGGRGRITLVASYRIALMLSLGITHRNSQGGTLNRIVLNIGSREINSSQTSSALCLCR